METDARSRESSSSSSSGAWVGFSGDWGTGEKKRDFEYLRESLGTTMDEWVPGPWVSSRIIRCGIGLIPNSLNWSVRTGREEEKNRRAEGENSSPTRSSLVGSNEYQS